VSLNNRIVSIVDDDPHIIFFHEALQSIPGIRIFTFTDPVLALDHFQVNDYAYVLVLSDFKIWLEWHGITKKDIRFESLRKNDTNESVHNR